MALRSTTASASATATATDADCGGFSIGQKLFSSNPLYHCVKAGGCSATAGKGSEYSSSSAHREYCLRYLLESTNFKELVNLPDSEYTCTQHANIAWHLSPLAAAVAVGDAVACSLLLENGAASSAEVNRRAYPPVPVSTHTSETTETPMRVAVAGADKTAALLQVEADAAHEARKALRALLDKEQHHLQQHPTITSLSELRPALVSLRSHIAHNTRSIRALLLRMHKVQPVQSSHAFALLHVVNCNKAHVSGGYDTSSRGAGAGFYDKNLGKVAANLRVLVVCVLQTLKASLSRSNATSGGRTVQQQAEAFTPRDWAKSFFRSPSLFDHMQTLTRKVAMLLHKQSLQENPLTSDVDFSLIAVVKRAKEGMAAMGASTGRNQWQRLVQDPLAAAAIQLMLDFCSCLADGCRCVHA